MSDIFNPLLDDSNALYKICINKLDEVSKIKGIDFKGSTRTSEIRPFAQVIEDAVFNKHNALIAELKKASPSKGLIRHDFDIASLAKSYELGGAKCLSILTDQKYFQGHNDFLQQAKDAVPLPVLRKDFMIEPIQIEESYAIGADCVLLIMAALSDAQARLLENVATDLGMSVLIEVHNELELERALRLKSSLIGINNRNLKTMKIDMGVSKQLANQVPSDRVVICESGVENHHDILSMNDAGMYSFLVGSSLMEQDNVEHATKKLLTGEVS